MRASYPKLSTSFVKAYQSWTFSLTHVNRKTNSRNSIGPYQISTQKYKETCDQFPVYLSFSVVCLSTGMRKIPPPNVGCSTSSAQYHWHNPCTSVKWWWISCLRWMKQIFLKYIHHTLTPTEVQLSLHFREVTSICTRLNIVSYRMKKYTYIYSRLIFIQTGIGVEINTYV